MSSQNLHTAASLSASVEDANDKTALEVYMETEQKLKASTDPAEQVELLKWLGEQAYFVSNECAVSDRKEWLEKAYQRLKAARQLDPEDEGVLRSLAAATGRLAEESDVRSKIRLGFEFKAYLDEAIAKDKETDPEHTFELCHMRGRLAYTVLTLPLIERVLAKTFGAVPDVSIEGAIADLKKAAQLHPDMAENELFVAKCLIHKGDYAEAKEFLTRAAESTAEEVIEQEYIDEAKKLLRSIAKK